MKNKSKLLLTDVVILRPICIFLLVVYHSFIIYKGGWYEPVGFEPNEIYRWIAELSYSFVLQLFVLLSGYVYGYQCSMSAKNTLNIRALVLSKCKRLLLPSLIFSLVYFYMFYEYTNLSSFLIKVLSGAGHMWFLPMLFWCFIGGFLLNKWKCSLKIKLILCMILYLISIIQIPFGIGDMLRYLFFFYLGICIFEKKELLLNRNLDFLTIVLSCIFFVFFISIQFLKNIEVTDLLYKGIRWLIISIGTLVYTTVGCLLFWFFVNKKLKDGLIVKPWILLLNNYCFGVYLFQQFILLYLYYYTPVPNYVNSCWLPWIGLSVTIVLSLFFTWIMRRTKYGRFLLE